MTGRERTAAYGGTVDLYGQSRSHADGRVAGGADQVPRRITLWQFRERPGRPDSASQHRRLFPLTNKLDEELPITVTDLNYTQFLSPCFGVFSGKLDTL